MTVQEQLADNVARVHTTFADAVVQWAEKVQPALTIPRQVLLPFDAVALVDKVFDAAQDGIELNRRVVKSFVSTTTSLVETGGHVAEGVGRVTRHSAEVAGDALREEAEILKKEAHEAAEAAEREAHEAAEAAEREAHEQARAARREARQEAKDRYADKNKAELQDELEKRDMAKTGTVDELRDRLVDADMNGAS